MFFPFLLFPLMVGSFTMHPHPHRHLRIPSSVFSSILVTAVEPPTSPGSNPASASAPNILSRRWRKSTKQVATLGPASHHLIEQLFLAGADVFRLNFSHGTREEKDEIVNKIRAVERKYVRE